MENVDVIVPGSGDLCDPSETEILTEYIAAMRERVREHFSNDYTRRETVDRVKMLDFFSVPAAREGEITRRIRNSVERIYDEFKKGKESKTR